MDFDPQHEQSLHLPLHFPGEMQRTASQTHHRHHRKTSSSLNDQQQQQRQQQQHPQPPRQRNRQQRQQRHTGQEHLSPAETPSRRPSSPIPERAPTFTIYVRVPVPRNGFEDPPDVVWSREKDDALWRILSRVDKNDINWEELADKFDATVGFLLVQATLLTERYVSQVRAQTRKVAALNARDSPSPPPSAHPPASGSTSTSTSAAQNYAGGPSSAAMGRTHSGIGGEPRRAQTEAMQRTGSAGGGGGGSARAGTPVSSGPQYRSMHRPQSQQHDNSHRRTRTGEENVSRQSQHHHWRHRSYDDDEQEREEEEEGDDDEAEAEEDEDDEEEEDRRYDVDDGGNEADPEQSPVATSTASISSSSSSSSSTPSQPVMSRIFKRPPGHPTLLLQESRVRTGGGSGTGGGEDRPSRTSRARFGGHNSSVDMSLSLRESTESDNDNDDNNGEESEPQAAFLPFKSPTLAATTSGRSPSRRTLSGLGSPRNRSDISPSSSASMSPTSRSFRSPSTSAMTRVTNSAGTATVTSSNAAAARLQSSRLPGGLRSPPLLHQNQHGLSPGRTVLAKTVGISREGSETGTTPSMGSSFSDLDDVSFTQSVLDEALASRVEDTILTGSPNTNTDTMSLSGNSRRQR